jgi:fructosamine-3-kinase
MPRRDPSPSGWQSRVADVVGPIGPVQRLAGRAYAFRASGRALVAKLGPGARDEANGLCRLGAVRGAPPVPEVVHLEEGLLVVSAVERVPRREGHDQSLGTSLAMLHAASEPQWGGGSSFIGACAVDPSSHVDAVAFYGARLSELAGRCALEGAVEPVVARLGELLPPGGPALLHGDLWWGNVLAGADGRSWLIDPSVHGGHPEEDLAMLALFGPVPERLHTAYREVAPLRDGWEARVPLFQLYPLLVHTVLFGGTYRAQAEAAARRYA